MIQPDVGMYIYTIYIYIFLSSNIWLRSTLHILIIMPTDFVCPHVYCCFICCCPDTSLDTEVASSQDELEGRAMMALNNLETRTLQKIQDFRSYHEMGARLRMMGLGWLVPDS